MNATAHAYERVTFRTESGRARTVYLHRPTVIETQFLGDLLTGTEVNREGDEISGKRFDERRHVIALEAVLTRVPMRMDNIYGELVEVAE